MKNFKTASGDLNSLLREVKLACPLEIKLPVRKKFFAIRIFFFAVRKNFLPVRKILEGETHDMKLACPLKNRAVFLLS